MGTCKFIVVRHFNYLIANKRKENYPQKKKISVSSPNVYVES